MNPIFLTLIAAKLTLCFPVTSSRGGNNNAQLFFCETPGCATAWTRVFCNDVLRFTRGSIINCTGLPPLNTVCHHDGRAFIFTDADDVCEFEGVTGYMKTKTCADLSNMCDFINATTSSPTSTKGQQNVREDHAMPWGYIVGGFSLVLLLLLISSIITVYFCKHSRLSANDLVMRL